MRIALLTVRLSALLASAAAANPLLPPRGAATWRDVDWVGTDFYRAFPDKPFVFGEWALWGGDDPGFVSRLFAWIGGHPRVKMALYNQGALTNGPFRLNRYPRSKAALRKALAHRRFAF